MTDGWIQFGPAHSFTLDVKTSDTLYAMIQSGRLGFSWRKKPKYDWYSDAGTVNLSKKRIRVLVTQGVKTLGDIKKDPGEITGELEIIGSFRPVRETSRTDTVAVTIKSFYEGVEIPDEEVPAKREDFIRDMELVYTAPGGTDEYLNRYAAETGKSWKLSVNFKVVNRIVNMGPTEPAPVSDETMRNEWATGNYLLSKFWASTGDWYHVRWAAVLEEIDVVPPPALPVTEAKKEDFIRDMELVYKCGGESAFLNEFCKKTGADWVLTVNLREVLEIEGPFDVKPLGRTYDVVTMDWAEHKEVARRLHEATGKWYWVTYPAELKETRVIPEPTPARQAWIDYFKDPDIIKAIGLVPSAIQDSFSKVFTGYSIIDEKPAEPEVLDYAGVAGIVGGLALGTLGTVLGATGAGLGITAPGLVGKYAIVSSVSYKAAPTIIVPVMKGAMTSGAWSKLTKIMLGMLLISQLDVIAWGFGFSPTKVHDRIDRLIRSARSSLITLDKMVKEQKWAEARTIVEDLEKQINETEAEFKSMPATFFEGIGASFEDLKVTFDTMRTELQAYRDAYPALKAIPTTFPEEFLIEDAQVEDGDTLIWPGHPEVQDRIRMLGIDAHESGTAAGKEETEYLKSLIEHRQVKIKTHQYHDPEMVIGLYGRLLGGVFLGDTDIALAMLEHFGSSILAPSKYRKKYRWIDWDLYIKTAKAATGPAVKEFKISVDSMPSNAKLFIDDSYTGHLTPSNEKELKDAMYLLTPGEHVFKATKGGKEGSIKTTITDGANPAIMIVLGVAGLEPVEPEVIPPVEPPVVEEFSISIDSSPTRAKLYIDDIYTHHWTPSNTKELSDVMGMLAPGMHTIKVTKAGKEASVEVEILPGKNEPILLTLGVVGLARSRENIEKDLEEAKALIARLEAELATL